MAKFGCKIFLIKLSNQHQGIGNVQGVMHISKMQFCGDVTIWYVDDQISFANCVKALFVCCLE